ncbi:hypothetical protein KWR14_005775 [Clostridioides difficile]|nr:hypothetical protein [uncultured Clostridioides sp.]EGT5422327.1 hypothetical protein [Clostridioides difficile]MBH7487384.1 hypothetical protein [Clostridioides difficile]MBY1671771.1 hypothetical protein [Clostridioides difficile]MBY1793851.1 hypothetical protein [Clostridioides difficile]MBY1996655.1 hypothetical protein [Clostridioides difficile]
MTNEEFEKIEEIYCRCKALKEIEVDSKDIKDIIENSDGSNLRMISFDFGWSEDLEFKINKEVGNYIKKEIINMLENVIQDCSEKIEAIKIPKKVKKRIM